MLEFFGFTGFGTINPGYLSGDYDPNLHTEGFGLAYFVRNALNSLWLVAGLAAFAYMVMGGFRYITAGGDVKATQEATKQLTGAAIGLVLVIASYAAARLMGAILGIELFIPVFKGPNP